MCCRFVDSEPTAPPAPTRGPRPSLPYLGLAWALPGPYLGLTWALPGPALTLPGPNPCQGLRPNGAMIAKRDRGPCPMGRRVRHLHDGFEMAQGTRGCCAQHRPTLK